MPDRWRRSDQDEFRDRVWAMRELHSTAIGDEDPVKRRLAREQWYERMQILMERLAETPTVWRGVQEPASTPWQIVLDLLGTKNFIVWMVAGVVVWQWFVGGFKLPFGG